MYLFLFENPKLIICALEGCCEKVSSPLLCRNTGFGQLEFM